MINYRYLFYKAVNDYIKNYRHKTINIFLVLRKVEKTLNLCYYYYYYYYHHHHYHYYYLIL